MVTSGPKKLWTDRLNFMSAVHDLAQLLGVSEAKEYAARDLYRRGEALLRGRSRSRTRRRILSSRIRPSGQTYAFGSAYGQKRGRFSGGYAGRKRRLRRRTNWARRRKGFGRMHRRRRGITYKKVRKMIQHADEDDSINTYRNIASFQISAAANQCAYEDFYLNPISVLDSSITNTTIVYNNTAVPDVQTVNLGNTTNVSSCKVNFINTQLLLELRNNWSVPCNLEVYKFFCKDHTNTTLIGALTSDLQGKGITAPTTDPRTYPFDASQEMWKYWKMYQHQHHYLMPGEELTIKLSRRRFKYDPTIQEAYARKITIGCLLRLQGVVAHDTTNHTDVGYQPCRLDGIYREHYKYTAELDRNFKFLHPATDTSLPDETGGYVTNNMDVEHNLRGA